MIISGGSRKNGAYFGRHLLRADHNERVEVVEIRGLLSENIGDALREMKAIASGTRCYNYFYHCSLSPREEELLTAEQWMVATNTLEQRLGLVDQPRFVVQHEKDGRTHQHVIWSRIDADSMMAVSDSLTYSRHEAAAREIELLFGHEPVPSVLVKDRETERPERNAQDWESRRATDTKIDPKLLKVEVTELWKSSDTGTAFAAALEDRGYILTRGDKRDFCIIDAAGDEHSLGRRLAGVKAAVLRERMADINSDLLPSVAEGRELARSRLDASSGDKATIAALQEEAPDALREETATPSVPVDDLHAIHAEMVKEMQAENPERFTLQPPLQDTSLTELEAVHNHSIASAVAGEKTLEREEAAEPGGRFERIRSWWGGMKVQFNDWREHVAERIDHYRDRWEHRQPLPTSAPELPTAPMEPE